MSVEFEVSEVINSSPEALYDAWLDSALHTKMTGSTARVSSKAGEPFEAWDGYIRGVNLELERPNRILQSWRTSDFDDGDEDSLVEILFKQMGQASRITIRHSRLPADGLQYQQGWIDYYFVPMKVYFG